MKSILYRWLGKVTKHPQEQRNIVSLGLNMMIKNVDTPLFLGTELQTFQVKVGLSNVQIGSLQSIGQITMAVSMFLFMGVSDRVRNRVRANALLTLAMATYPLVLAILAFGPTSFRTPSVAFPVMAGAEVVEKAVMGLMGLMFAALYVRAISNRIRGRFTGIIGVVGGAIGVVFGLLASWVLRELGYPSGFTLVFGTGVGLMVLAFMAVKHVRELPELAHEEASGSISPFSSLAQIVRMREFRLLVPPNVLRGLADGAGFFAMAVGIRQLGLGVEYAGYTTSLIYLGGLIGTLVVGLTVDRYGPGLVLFGAGLFLAVALSGMVLSPTPLIFLGFYLLLSVSSTVEGYTVPLAHYYIVPTPVIGAFSGARLILLLGTNAIVVPTAGYLLDRMEATPIFLACAGLKICTGLLYWYAFSKGKKDGFADKAA